MTKEQALAHHQEFVCKLNERAKAESLDLTLWYQLLLTTPDDFLLEGELEVKQLLRQFH